MGCRARPPAHPLPPTLPQTIEYNEPSYLGNAFPVSIYNLAIANSVLMGGVELFRQFFYLVRHPAVHGT